MTTHRPLALVTGASSGIGLALARQFAEHGHDLVLAARSERLEQAVRDLEATGVSVVGVRADLATREGNESVIAALGGRVPDAAAINAGIGSGGRFAETDLDDELELVDLNVRSTVHLAKHVARGMTARGSGRILFTASIAATHPDPFEAVYGASKTFVNSFALALRHELAESGVTVTSLMPGPTETDFFHRAGMDDTKIGASDSKDDPDEVARLAYEGLMNGDAKVVPGAANKAIGAAARILPDRAKAALHAKLAEPGSA
jgi:short-subunit dehydrogenase